MCLCVRVLCVQSQYGGGVAEFSRINKPKFLCADAIATPEDDELVCLNCSLFVTLFSLLARCLTDLSLSLSLSFSYSFSSLSFSLLSLSLLHSLLFSPWPLHTSGLSF